MAKLLSGTRIYGTGTVDSQLFVSGSNSATSTITGALQVIGGAGIGGDLWLGGGNVNIVKSSTNLIMGDSNLTSTGTTNVILGRSIAGDAATIKTYAGASTNLRIFNSVAGYHFDLASYATSGWGPTGVNDGTRIRIDGATGDVKILNQSNATTTNTGALQVIGGVGIGGDLYVGGIVNATVVGSVTTATNLRLGTVGQIPFQNATNSTTFFGPGSLGQLLVSAGASSTGPVFTNTSSIQVGYASNIFGGSTGTILYQSAVNTTALLAVSTSGYILQTNGTGQVPSWVNPNVSFAPINLTASTGTSFNYVVGVAAAGSAQLATISTSTSTFGFNAQTGNVGIGIISPTVKLHIVNSTNLGTASDNAGILVSSTNRNGYIQLDGYSTRSSSVVFSNVGTEVGRINYDNTNNFMAFGVNGVYGTSEKMRITANGGISFGASGTAYGSTGQFLQSNGDAAPTWVSGGSISSGQVQTVQQTANTIYYPTFVNANNASATAMSVYTSSSFVINPSTGFHGIGTASPASKLHVNGSGEILRLESAGGNGRYIRFNDGGGTKFNFIVGVQQTIDNGFEITPSTAAGGSAFSTPAFVISSTGSVGINQNTPVAKLDVVGGIIATQGFADQSGTNNPLRLISPGGASLWKGNTSDTGAIKIKLPQSVSSPSTMLKFRLSVYTYDGQSFDIYCGGYTWTGPSWLNTFAYMGTQSRPALNVRFGYDGSNFCVYVGELATVWAYANIFVTDFQAGYSNYAVGTWSSGWVITFEPTSFGTITPVVQVAYPPVTAASNNSAALANTYVGFGSAGGVLTGSSALTWDGTTLLTNSGSLGTGAGTQIVSYRFNVTTSNNDYLEVSNVRGTAGSDWQYAGWRLQQKVDSTWMGYIQFNGTSAGINNGGISFGSGTTTSNANSVSERMRIDGSGNVGIGIAPGKKLDVAGGARFLQDAAATTGAIVLRQNSGDSVGAYIQWVNNANSSERGWINVDTSGNMIFASVSTERLRINTNGAIAFNGASNYGTAGQVLQSNGNAPPTWVNTSTFVAGSTLGGSVNYATSVGWAAGVTGDQAGYYGGNFTLNGSSSENAMAYGTDPFGRRGILWGARNNDAASNDDGGWNKSITGLSPAKSYMSVVYVRRNGTNTSGSFYHGCDGSNTLDLNGVANTNPYFSSFGISTLPQDVWCVSIGFIQAYGDSNSANTARGGLYRMDTGQKIVAYTDYKMANGASQQTHRTYLYYSTDAAASLDWWGPGFYEINGNEPNLEQLLGSNNAGWRKNWYAPAYYDSDDINYYLDPNSTGVALRARGQLYTGPNSSGRYTRFGGDGGSADEATVSASNGNLHIDSKTSYGLYLNYYSNGDIIAMNGGGNFYSYTNVRSPIFYDYTDSSYYLDPNGGGKVTGTWLFARNNNSSTAYSDAGIQLRESQYGSTSAYNPPAISWNWAGVVASQISIESSGRIKVVNNPGTGYENFIANIVYGSASVRAPIFYDNDNTGYYVDPAGTTQLNVLLANHMYNGVVSSGSLSAGTWYTIAANSGSRASARFQIVDQTSGLHQTVVFYAAHHFGTDSSNAINVVSNSFYSGAPLAYIRIKDGATYEGAVVQVYIAYAVSGVRVFMYDNEEDASGWVLVNWVNDNTNPGTVSTWASLTEKSRVYITGDRNSLDISYAGYALGYDSRIRLVQGNSVNSDPMLRIQNDYAYADIGALNGSWFHQNTNAGGFYWYQYGQNAASWRAPIFYDSDDTGYYINPNSSSYVYSLTAASFLRSNGNVLIDANYGYSVMGTYSSTRYQGVWSMGTSWYLPADGTTTGNLYGLAWSYPSAGGAAANLASHGLLCLINGGFASSMSYNVVASSDVRGTIFYDYNDTGYYCDPNGQSSFSTAIFWGNNIQIRGSSPTIYFRDTDEMSAMLHNNSNLFYVLRGGVDSTTWSVVGSGNWPVYWNLSNNNCLMGGTLSVIYDVVAYASDIRLKENIVSIPNAIDKIKKIRGVTFDWNDKADKVGFIPEQKYNDLGVIAQEIQNVLPQAVSSAPFDRWAPDPKTDYEQSYLDEKMGTSRSGENYLTVKLEKIVPLLIEGIKDQQEMIEQQNEKISKLESLIEKLLENK